LVPEIVVAIEQLAQGSIQDLIERLAGPALGLNQAVEVIDGIRVPAKMLRVFRCSKKSLYGREVLEVGLDERRIVCAEPVDQVLLSEADTLLRGWDVAAGDRCEASAGFGKTLNHTGKIAGVDEWVDVEEAVDPGAAP
jgi:hypothetical protein